MYRWPIDHPKPGNNDEINVCLCTFLVRVRVVLDFHFRSSAVWRRREFAKLHSSNRLWWGSSETGGNWCATESLKSTHKTAKRIASAKYEVIDPATTIRKKCCVIDNWWLAEMVFYENSTSIHFFANNSRFSFCGHEIIIAINRKSLNSSNLLFLILRSFFFCYLLLSRLIIFAALNWVKIIHSWVVRRKGEEG